MKNILILILLSQAALSAARKKKVALPSFMGVIETAHYIKGRARFLIPALKANSKVYLPAIAELKKVEAVKNISVTPLTGSLTIIFDESKLEPFMLMSAVIKLFGLEEKLNKGRSSRITQEISLLIESIDKVIYDKSFGLLDLKSGVSILLISLLAYSFAKNQYALSAKATLLWWLYDSLKPR